MAGYYDRDRNPRLDSTGISGTRTAAGTMNHPMTHHGNVAEYQVSGIPFFHAFTSAADTVHTITFPFVTQWIQIVVPDNEEIKVAYCKEGLAHTGGNFEDNSLSGGADTRLLGTNYVTIDGSNSADIPNGSIWRMKTNQIALIGDSTILVSIVAGLTNVPSSDFPDLSAITGIGTSLDLGGNSIQSDDTGA